MGILFQDAKLFSRRNNIAMKRGRAANASMGTTILFLGAFLISAIPPAAAKTLTPAQYPDQCVALNRNVSLHQPAVADYKCQYKDEKLLIDTSGSMAPAPEGVYKTSKDGKECLVGKGGIVLACIR